VQRLALRRASGLVMLTDAVRRHLGAALPADTPLEVIPCCVDLARIDGAAAADRVAARAALGLEEGPVMIYVGKFTGWYMEREMADFFAAARREHPDLRLLVVTQADPAPIEAELARVGVGREHYVVNRSAPEEIGRYLAAADFGISFVRPCVSKISSSPTKVAEYLAAGLPTVTTAIGDLPELLAGGRAGVLVEAFSSPAYDEAAAEVARLVADPEARERCRRLARERLSLDEVGIPRYDRLYRAVAGR
jgi:glycosyltransferase involved in cell wall biosynthesis